MNLFGQINLSALSQIIRNHPELVKTVSRRDGTTFQVINVDINERQQQGTYGDTHYIRVSGLKKQDVKPGDNVYICDLRPSQQQTVSAPQSFTDLANSFCPAPQEAAAAPAPSEQPSQPSQPFSAPQKDETLPF